MISILWWIQIRLLLRDMYCRHEVPILLIMMESFYLWCYMDDVSVDPNLSLMLFGYPSLLFCKTCVANVKSWSCLYFLFYTILFWIKLKKTICCMLTSSWIKYCNYWRMNAVLRTSISCQKQQKNKSQYKDTNEPNTLKTRDRFKCNVNTRGTLI